MILHGDSLIVLKDFPDDSIDAVVTDPPYGLKFMGKKWDYEVPSVELWKEVLRVLKPGGYVLSFGGTRTYHRMVCNMEDAGLEIRDQVQWIYGSGFPKSHNGDHGGTALKPANEPICLARKPLIGTVAKNFEKYGTGGLNIDASRIGTDSTKRPFGRKMDIYGGHSEEMESLNIVGSSDSGRWPANVLFDEEAAAVLDEQSGDKCGASRFFYVAKASKRERNARLEGMPLVMAGAISGKETRSNRPSNHTLRQNHHPTVKPIKLMEYLIKLITPPNGIVLDPFMGSGSTGVAAKNLGFEFIGIEMNEEYVKIAEKRIGAE